MTGGELEPLLPPRRRIAQAALALCIEKAKTFWGAKK